MSYQPPYDWNRDGNCLWTLCPACDFQFPVTLVLAERTDVSRCCPRCHNEITAAGSADSSGGLATD